MTDVETIDDSPIPPQVDDAQAPTRSRGRMEIQDVELVGGRRVVRFRPGLNLIQGDITTGKTTFVRLIRSLFGSVPDGLPPEVDLLTAIRGKVVLGDAAWQIYRPVTTTANAPVEIAEAEPPPGREPIAVRLPAAGRERSYSLFLLERLGIPAVSVPQARTKPTGTLVPVTMTDWLGYCIIPGDELDSDVFGHNHPYRDQKRRYVFELAYGYYDFEAAQLNVELRNIELQLEMLDREAVVRERFLADTPFADAGTLLARIAEQDATLHALRVRRRTVAAEMTEATGGQGLRDSLLAARYGRDELAISVTRLEAQLHDLADLEKQLASQSARLTRAIVADEWLIDFDFVVCPRCGNDVDAGRAPADQCYLCLQTPRPAPSREQLLAEQYRVTSQIEETRQVADLRRKSLDEDRIALTRLDDLIRRTAAQLDEQTAAYVSDRAAALQQYAAEEASIQAEIARLNDYLVLFQRHEAHRQNHEQLQARQAEVQRAIERRELGHADAEANVRALEQRMLEYLNALHIPQLGIELTVKINRKTYMPEVSGRSFNELSSQGLKTLVNIAHSLAHHTVAIDRDLPMPGLLVLDGLSANTGYEGFDQDRVNDAYRLLRSVAAEYVDRLQIVAVDNELPRTMFIELAGYVILTLTQDNRLIQIPAPDPLPGAGRPTTTGDDAA
jgi:hypothetical protein